MTESNERTAPDPESSTRAEAARAGESDQTHNETPSEAPSALEAVTAERDKLRDQLLRTAADFDNFRKRSKRDVDDARQRGKDELVRDLLPVFDNLERAVQTADTASDLKAVVDGVRMVLKLFEDTTERMGLQRVSSVGERFDPAVHEAIQQQETDAQPPGTIIAEVVPGYRFGQRLVRPAMVVVARKPSEPKPDAGKPGDGGGQAAAASAASVRPPAGASQKPAAADGQGAAPEGSETKSGGADAKDKE